MANLGQEVLYVSGEESAQQVKMRLDRLGLPSAGVSYLGEEQVEIICQTAIVRKPALVIVDSIQTIRASDAQAEPGSVNQIKACTVKLLACAKRATAFRLSSLAMSRKKGCSADQNVGASCGYGGVC